jgi:hypothetical protein
MRTRHQAVAALVLVVILAAPVLGSSSSTFLCDRCGTVLAQMWSSPALNPFERNREALDREAAINQAVAMSLARRAGTADMARPAITSTPVDSMPRLAPPFGSATGGAGQWKSEPMVGWFEPDSLTSVLARTDSSTFTLMPSSDSPLSAVES